MNWEALRFVADVAIAAVGVGNLFVVLAIKKEIAIAVGAVKEWAREEFVTKREVDQRFSWLKRGI